MKNLSSRKKSAFTGISRSFCVSLLIIFTCLQAQAQNAEFTQNNSPTSRAVTLEVPLANYPGRGISLPVKLRYSNHGLWRIGFINSIPMGSSVWRGVTEAIYAEHSTAGWTTSLDIPKVEWPRQNDIYWYTGKPYPRGTVSPFTFRVANLFMHMPDGSMHEMRKADAVYQDGGFIDMVGTFYSVDGSRMRYDSTGPNTGTLFLPNGTRYILGTTTCQLIDRNGNTLNYNIESRQWTDTLGRVIGMPWPVNPGPGNYTYSVPAFNNSTIDYILKFQPLSSTLTPDAQGQTPGLKPIADHYLLDPNSSPTGPGGSNHPQQASGTPLFVSGFTDPEETSQSFMYVVGRGQSGSNPFDPTVLAEIVLPTGLSYKFSYNIHGELTKVIYPTGGYQRYQYSQVSTFAFTTFPYFQGNRGMISRSISANGTGTDEAQWTYSTGTFPMTVMDPDGTRTEVFHFVPTNETENFGYLDARAGLVTEEQIYAPVAQGGAMLRRTLHQYGITTSVLNKPVPPNTFNTGTYTAFRNARAEKMVNIIFDTGGDALAKTTIHEYIDNGFQFSTGLDQNALTETHFASVPQATAESQPITAIPAGTTATRTETQYLNNSAYRNRHILNLPTAIILKGIVSGTLQSVAQTQFAYDEGAYPLLPYGDLTGPDYIDPNTTARGNVTTTTHYVDAAATIPLITHSQFDQCGNLRISEDARGLESEIEYSSEFKHALPTVTRTAVPDPSGVHGSTTALTSSTTFDYTSGLVLTRTDVNERITTFSYRDDQNNIDPLNRLRKITRPDGGWTKFSFGDSLGNVFTLTEVQQDATRTLKAYDYVDPMGRPSRSFTSEGGSNYIAIDTIYDQMGRVWKMSNPYRTTTLDGMADISHTSNWTISTYDPLGRGLGVTLPDGSVMQTSYEGVYATVTDQAGKQRRQKIDSLGRVIRIDEPNSSGSLGAPDAPTQATSYDYDPQGNIVHIAQGTSPVQHRYFKYDALGRLTHERQVEQAAIFTAADPVTGNSSWTRRLVYDETIDLVTYLGLLTNVYDSRNVQTTFRYDNLNRTFQVSYSDGTPTVTNKYDQNRTGYFNKGHLTEALTAAAGSIPATSQLYDFNSVGRVVHHEQTVGSQTYTMGYGYNLSGALTSQTYPSGRVVNYAFDEGARLSHVSSGATSYASQYDYTSSTGLLKSVTLGNNAVESYVYNARLQLQSLDVTRDGTQIQHFDYKYGVYDPATNTLDETKNNGQIAQIEGFINAQKQWQQRYAYDKLGRLASTREFRGDNSQQSYLVNYDYDVFGNRYQKQAQNGGNPFTQIWVETAHVDLATNRFSTGVTYDAAGNVTNDSKFRNRKFEYDANNRTKQSRNLDDSGAVDSVFDATGQRVATQVAGSLINIMVYDATAKLVAEYNSTPVQGGTQYIFSDHQGSPRTITNAQGSVIARHDYLPFGEDVLNSVGMRSSGQGYGGNEAARQKFAGMETNEATAMAHTLWRQYDSLSGRWTAPDPYRGSMSIQNPQSLNRYSYVDNDPINLVDPAGLMPKLADASTSWSDVADGFWGQGNLMNRPRNIGQLIIALASARRDRLIKARIDGKLVAEYLRKRKFEAAKRILNSNPDVGLYQDGKQIWGELAATYVEGVEGATSEAMVASSDALKAMDLALRILVRAGWRAVVNRLKKLRGPDFAILNVNLLAGITRFIPRGESMETALQGVSASNAEGQLSFAVGWLIQLETPTKEEIVEWGKGLSVNVDIFVVGGGGIMRSFSSDVRAVYVGVGVGGGWGASFQYKVW